MQIIFYIKYPTKEKGLRAKFINPHIKYSFNLVKYYTRRGQPKKKKDNNGKEDHLVTKAVFEVRINQSFNIVRPANVVTSSPD